MDIWRGRIAWSLHESGKNVAWVANQVSSFSVKKIDPYWLIKFRAEQIRSMMSEIGGMSLADNFQDNHDGLDQFIRNGRIPKVCYLILVD